MKTRLALALTGLVSCLTIPALALSGDLAGKAGALEQLNELSQKLDRRSTSKTRSLAARPPDAVQDTAWSFPAKRSEFEQSPTTGHIWQTDQLHSMGNEAWSVGQW
jgi:hypothetical protein